LETLIKDINILSEKPGFDDFNDIIIKDGIITEIGKNLSSSKAIKINGEGLTCTPGFYDMHVHFRDPGQIHKEDIFSGTMAAASGGFTGVLCMPNTNPPVDNAMIVNYIRKKSRDLIVDIDICGCISKSREGNELAPILSLSKAGAIAFTDDGSPVSNPELLRRAFEYTAQINSIVIQHCEDMNLTNNGHINEGFYSSVTGLRGIPEISETSVIARDSLICSYVSGARYHVQHISCGKSVDIISGAKESGINLSCEVCPHHFILTDENCINYDTNFKMNPPLRTASDVQRILNGIKNDIVDVICTDHAPHTEYEKSQGFYDAPFGILYLFSKGKYYILKQIS
jgi:dihydroorotase